MELAAKEKKRLMAESHALKAQISIGADVPQESDVAHIRTAFTHSELLKVRIRSKRREDRDRAAVILTEQVPCQLVAGIGHVVILYRPLETPAVE
ncbi:MAG: YhbY family RNA-binding protein [Phycisphaerae bacterium]